MLSETFADIGFSGSLNNGDKEILCKNFKINREIIPIWFVVRKNDKDKWKILFWQRADRRFAYRVPDESIEDRVSIPMNIMVYETIESLFEFPTMDEIIAQKDSERIAFFEKYTSGEFSTANDFLVSSDSSKKLFIREPIQITREYEIFNNDFNNDSIAIIVDDLRMEEFNHQLLNLYKKGIYIDLDAFMRKNDIESYINCKHMESGDKQIFWFLIRKIGDSEYKIINWQRADRGIGYMY